MTDEEKKYQEELAKNSVDLPEEKKADDAPKDEKPEEKSKADKSEEEKSKDDKPEDNQEPLQDKKPEEPPKRSIYDQYKDKKSELKTEKELREAAEARALELEQQLNDLRGDKGDKKADDAEKSIRELAAEKGADPELVDRIIAEARKGITPQLDENLKKDLDEFKTWRAQNSKVIEQQMFNDEFSRSMPKLKQLFPNASDDELTTVIKPQLDALSHTKEMHDKPLDYVAFAHSDTLGTLISPKKRGMETKDRKDVSEVSADFNPTPDFSRMTPKELAEWEKTYRAAGKAQNLVDAADGKKLLI